MDKIDIVIPWVDNEDLKWKSVRKLYLSNFSDNIDSIDKFYRDWNTLLYVFRGIEKFMPWVNKVHLLTFGHIPSWLNVDAPKLNVVCHEDFYFNKKDLPTFNSQSIEMNILGIKGLSEKFIYFNDDTLVLKDTPISRFFVDDLPLDFLVQGIPRQGYLYKLLISNDTYVSTMSNNLHLINSKFSKRELIRNKSLCFYNSNYSLKDRMLNHFFNLFPKYYWFSNYHFQQPYLKKNLIETYNLFRNEMNLTSSSKFRSRIDVNQYLYRYVRLCKGQFIPFKPNDTFCIVLDDYKKFHKNINKINKARFFCPNDSPSISQENYINIKEELTCVLNSILPDKSSFEK